MAKQKNKPTKKESDLERRLREAGLDQEEINEEALREFLGKSLKPKTKKKQI